MSEDFVTLLAPNSTHFVPVHDLKSSQKPKMKSHNPEKAGIAQARSAFDYTSHYELKAVGSQSDLSSETHILSQTVLTHQTEPPNQAGCTCSPCMHQIAFARPVFGRHKAARLDLENICQIEPAVKHAICTGVLEEEAYHTVPAFKARDRILTVFTLLEKMPHARPCSVAFALSMTCSSFTNWV